MCILSVIFDVHFDWSSGVLLLRDCRLWLPCQVGRNCLLATTCVIRHFILFILSYYERRLWFPLMTLVMWTSLRCSSLLIIVTHLLTSQRCDQTAHSVTDAVRRESTMQKLISCPNWRRGMSMMILNWTNRVNIKVQLSCVDSSH